MKRIYIAGAYSAPNVLGVMDNMRRGLKLSAQCLKAGFAVYSPWTDCLLHFHEEFTLEQCYTYSDAWLRVSDAVLLVPGWEESVGVRSELKVAAEIHIPVFHTLADLCAHFLGGIPCERLNQDGTATLKSVEHGWDC